MQYHVAFLQKDPLSRVMRGIKRAEVRLPKARHAARVARVDDVLLFKAVGGGIVAAATITAVHVFEDLRPQDVRALGEVLAPLTGADPHSGYWQAKADARYAVVIEFAPPRVAHLPAEHTPVGVFSGWVSCHPAVGLTIY